MGPSLVPFGLARAAASSARPRRAGPGGCQQSAGTVDRTYQAVRPANPPPPPVTCTRCPGDQAAGNNKQRGTDDLRFPIAPLSRKSF